MITGQAGELAIARRARQVELLTSLVEDDHRVVTCRGVEFAEDGGVVVTVELRPGPDRMGAAVIAREVGFELAARLPSLSWVRVNTETKA